MQYNISFMSLLETKIKDTKVLDIAKKIANNWDWCSNASCTEKGRIISLWDPSFLEVHIIKSSPQQITCNVKALDGSLNCIISLIYGYNSSESRKDLWNELGLIQQTSGNIPWLLSGDFNAMINNEEKLGGAVLTEADTRDFNEFIDDCQLSHLKTIGCFYTWNNKQDTITRVWSNLKTIGCFYTWNNKQDTITRVWSRLDRALVNDQWINLVNSSHVEYMLPSFSDHSPALVLIYADNIQGEKPFKFFKMWTKHDDFLPTVSAIWGSYVDGYKMFSVFSKLKQLKGSLKELNKRHFHNISEQVQRAKLALEEIQKKLQSDPFNDALISQERSLNLMGSATPTSTPDINVIRSGPCLLESHANLLYAPVTKDEIKVAMFSMPDNKAPGPDGYSASFFKSSWSIIGDEVTATIKEFFRMGKLLGVVNSTYIALIPKIQCPKTPTDFRLISYCNCLYKIISKILANRIQSVMGFLTNEAQCAFVKSRQITNNMLLAHELVKNYGRKHVSPRVMINIDIRKAFDTISWKFLQDILNDMGFPKVFTSWITTCIPTPRYSISLNGSLHGYFKGKRGLRQGDPLSPYLFILGIKGELYSVQKIYDCVKDFGEKSGLEANPSKCAIYYGGVEESIKGVIRNSLNFPEGSLPIKYLGLPLISKRMSYIDCSPLFIKILGQFQAWVKLKKLSYAGRLQIIKSVILGIQIFWTSCYILPVKVLRRIDELCRNILWGNSDQKFKPPLVNWEKVCTGKKNGGLGIISASLWNTAAALRTIWIWNAIMDWLKFKWRASEWRLLLDWYNSRLKGKGITQRIKRMALSTAVYTIWRERNDKLFKGQTRSSDHLIKSIKVDILTILLNSPIPAEEKVWLSSL
ncbi:uncharacterized protein LOC109830891 [Asparagus officinalis]|uniref:uncharacterized protein LOC109830891 n=1 Tax=Asparagus officinalis TaxID=4686 RepID=UPI00098E15CA|nr:uncharacterized protein LOC109830891 [Asparagus officinalis]